MGQIIPVYISLKYIYRDLKSLSSHLLVLAIYLYQSLHQILCLSIHLPASCPTHRLFQGIASCRGNGIVGRVQRFDQHLFGALFSNEVFIRVLCYVLLPLSPSWYCHLRFPKVFMDIWVSTGAFTDLGIIWKTWDGDNTENLGSFMVWISSFSSWWSTRGGELISGNAASRNHCAQDPSTGPLSPLQWHTKLLLNWIANLGQSQILPIAKLLLSLVPRFCFGSSSKQRKTGESGLDACSLVRPAQVEGNPHQVPGRAQVVLIN